MPYREQSSQPVSPESAELAAYEEQLRRQAKRKQVVFGLVLGGLAVVGVGSCLGPVGVSIAQEAWRRRKTKLSSEEGARVNALLGPIEANAEKSQAAFEAIWPKIRGREIGARGDLGRCRVGVPGPRLRTKDDSRSLEDSAQAHGWTFIDLTPPDARSPIETLQMPKGSIALNNTGTGDRFVLPGRPLKTAPPDKAPTLTSTAMRARAAELRAESTDGIRAEQHEEFLERVERFADSAMGIDVVVFLDAWEDPRLSNEVAPAPTPPKDDLEAFARPAPRPKQLFESGFAVARAIAWDPAKQEVACASQAMAFSSEHVTFRGRDVAPLQQDLVLELQAALQRSFVAVGEAPPKIERPPTSATGTTDSRR